MSILIYGIIVVIAIGKGLSEIEIDENDVNVRNELSRGKFTAVKFIQCLDAIRTSDWRLP